MGSIYVIKNTVNNKLYVGQTIFSIDLRFKQHIVKAESGTTKLYRAIRELGVHNFYVELLEEVENTNLDERENYYIECYDTINNGYNSILNGEEQHNLIKFYHIDKMLDNLYNDYINGMSFTDLSIKYDKSINSLNKLLRDIIGVRVDKEQNLDFTVKEIEMYDYDFNPQGRFKSVRDAYRWLCQNSEFRIDLRNTYSYIKRACGCGSIAYGHRWQLASELIYKNMLFRTKFEKDAYITGATAYKPEGKNYYVVDGVLDKIIHKHKHKQAIKRCSICGKPIDINAEMCRDCYNQKIASNIPDINTLASLISKHSYEEIGRMYGVTGKAVRKWCDKYNLVQSQERDSSGVTCVELNMHFETFKEAAQYLIDNNYSVSENKSIAYKISNAKKNGNRYLNFHWT